MGISDALTEIKAEIAAFVVANSDADYATALRHLVNVRVMWAGNPTEMEHAGKGLRFNSLRDINDTIKLVKEMADQAASASLGIQTMNLNPVAER